MVAASGACMLIIIMVAASGACILKPELPVNDPAGYPLVCNLIDVCVWGGGGDTIHICLGNLRIIFYN